MTRPHADYQARITLAGLIHRRDELARELAFAKSRLKVLEQAIAIAEKALDRQRTRKAA